MSNPYLEYYTNQAGSGLTGFQGYQYQRGHGFFGSLFQNILKPLGRYLGRQFLSTGVNVGNDILSGENLTDSIIKNTKKTSKNMLNDGIARAQKFAQTGSGKRKRRRKSRKVSKLAIKKRVNRKIKPLKKKRRRKKSSKKSKHNSKFKNLFV